MDEVDNHTTILMGHTRWRTRGSEANSRNNHPIRAGIIIGTHNGTIYNADYLFRRLGLPRYAEVDSELLSGWPTASLPMEISTAEASAKPYACVEAK